MLSIFIYSQWLYSAFKINTLKPLYHSLFKAGMSHNYSASPYCTKRRTQNGGCIVFPPSSRQRATPLCFQNAYMISEITHWGGFTCWHSFFFFSFSVKKQSRIYESTAVLDLCKIYHKRDVVPSTITTTRSVTVCEVYI